MYRQRANTARLSHQSDRHSIADTPSWDVRVQPALSPQRSIQPDTPEAAIEDGRFLYHLAAAIADSSGAPFGEAEVVARQIYDQAQQDYLGYGAAIYGRTHSGLMRWIGERLAIGGLRATHADACERDESLVAPETLLPLDPGQPECPLIRLALALRNQPDQPVTIDVGMDAPALATPASISFTAENWNVPQTVAIAIR
jgi:hypothetical protein